MNYTISTPPARLREGDTVTFTLPTKELVYTVKRLPKSGLIALVQPRDAPNREIFSYLGIEGDDVLDMARAAFGHDPEGSKWPRSAGFAAQVRLVWALYAALTTDERPARDPLTDRETTIRDAVLNQQWDEFLPSVKALVNAIMGKDLF